MEDKTFKLLRHTLPIKLRFKLEHKIEDKIDDITKTERVHYEMFQCNIDMLVALNVLATLNKSS